MIAVLGVIVVTMMVCHRELVEEVMDPMGSGVSQEKDKNGRTNKVRETAKSGICRFLSAVHVSVTFPDSIP